MLFVATARGAEGTVWCGPTGAIRREHVGDFIAKRRMNQHRVV